MDTVFSMKEAKKSKSEEISWRYKKESPTKRGSEKMEPFSKSIQTIWLNLGGIEDESTGSKDNGPEGSKEDVTKDSTEGRNPKILISWFSCLVWKE